MRKITVNVSNELGEKTYTTTLDNGLKVYICKKEGFSKKIGLFGTKYGSLINDFVDITTGKRIKVPDGIAHFLEHKLFEKEGANALDLFSKMGVSSNAYTSFDQTVFYFETIDKFKESIEMLVKLIKEPYFTDENVEKEKGIIGQEIMMYDDYPEWKVYLNTLEAMYHEHPVKLDITGTIETISHIDKDILYKCYNTFYNPANMAMVICGDFEPEKLLEEIKKRLIEKKANGEIKRIYPEEPESIVKEKIEQKMDVSEPLFTIGIKDKVATQKEKVKKHLAIEILLNMLIGKSSDLYQELYKSGVMFSMPGVDYEFSRDYAHILVTGQSKEPEKVYESFKNTIRELKEKGIESEEFKRMKKMLYGSFIKEYDEPGDIARMFLADFFKGINSFEYLEEITTINEQYVEQILNEVFNENKMILSVIKK